MSSLRFFRKFYRENSSYTSATMSSARVEFFDVSPYFITGLLSRNRVSTFELSNSVGRVSNPRKFSLTYDVAFRIDLRRMYTYQSPVHCARRTRQKSRDLRDSSQTLSTFSTRLKADSCFVTICFWVADFSPLWQLIRYKGENKNYSFLLFLFLLRKYIFFYR